MLQRFLLAQLPFIHAYRNTHAQILAYICMYIHTSLIYCILTLTHRWMQSTLLVSFGIFGQLLLQYLTGGNEFRANGAVHCPVENCVIKLIELFFNNLQRSAQTLMSGADA